MMYELWCMTANIQATFTFDLLLVEDPCFFPSWSSSLKWCSDSRELGELPKCHGAHAGLALEPTLPSSQEATWPCAMTGRELFKMDLGEFNLEISALPPSNPRKEGIRYSTFLNVANSVNTHETCSASISGLLVPSAGPMWTNPTHPSGSGGKTHRGRPSVHRGDGWVLHVLMRCLECTRMPAGVQASSSIRVCAHAMHGQNVNT